MCNKCNSASNFFYNTSNWNGWDNWNHWNMGDQCGCNNTSVDNDPFDEVERIARMARRRRNCENRAACEFVRAMRNCRRNDGGSCNHQNC